MNLKEYTELKSTAEELQRLADRRAGAVEELFEQLKNEHGVETIEGAESIQKAIAKKIEKLERRYDVAFAAIQKRWKGKLP